MRAQAGQIFIYIFALVLISLLFLYGYKAVKNFSSKSEEASYIQFQKQLEADIERISSDYGTTMKKDYLVPGGYKKVCFIDFDTDASVTQICLPASMNEDNHPIICDSWGNKIQKNVFLIKDTAKESFFVGDKEENTPYFQIEHPWYKCFDVSNGKLSIQIEGKGKYALIS